jgi:hypothetical protein
MQEKITKFLLQKLNKGRFNKEKGGGRNQRQVQLVEEKGTGWFLVIYRDDPPVAPTEQRPGTKPNTFYTPRHFVTPLSRGDMRLIMR